MEGENTKKIAFDLGGVIIHRDAMENHIVDESIMSVKLTVNKFHRDNVYIISKAKQKYIQRNLTLLETSGFFQNTNLRKDHVFFVNQYEDKGPLGIKLGINYIVDDSIKVAKVAIKSGFIPILFGDHEQFLKQNLQEGIKLNAKNWKNFRKILQKLER